MNRTRWTGLMLVVAGLLLATPFGLLSAATGGGGANLVVVAPGLAWLFWAVPAAAGVGLVLALLGASLIFRSVGPAKAKVS